MLKFEFKNSLISSLIWIILGSLVLLLFLAFYPAFKDQSQQMALLLENFPQQMLDAMGVDIDSFLSFGGFFTYLFSYVNLLVCIFSMNIGLSLSSLEKRSQSLDFLYVKPISRGNIIFIKLIVGLFYVLLFNLALLAIIMVTMTLNQISDWTAVINIWLAGLTLSLFFFGLGFLLGSFNLKIKKTFGISSAVVFLFFMMLLLGRMIDAQWLINLTPFGHFDFNHILQNSLNNLGIWTLMIILMIFLTFMRVKWSDLL